MRGLKVRRAEGEDGVKDTGATAQKVNERADGDGMMLQKAVKIHDGDTPEKLQKRVMKQAEWKILPEAAEIVSAELLKGKEDH